MRQETINANISIVEALPDGVWAVRWDFKPKVDGDGNETGTYWYEEETYNWIPTIDDIQKTIINWFNKQTDSLIEHGFRWNGIDILLNDENKFNYKAITDEAARREAAIVIWDENNPELAGVTYNKFYETDENGNQMEVSVPTGRPISLLPITLKLGQSNLPESFYTFATLNELQAFFASGVEHLINAYGAGWYKIATFDWTPYITALEELNN